jgi:hypothetical protein
MILLLSTILVLYIFEFGFVHAQNYDDDSNNNEIDDNFDYIFDPGNYIKFEELEEKEEAIIDDDNSENPENQDNLVHSSSPSTNNDLNKEGKLIGNNINTVNKKNSESKLKIIDGNIDDNINKNNDSNNNNSCSYAKTKTTTTISVPSHLTQIIIIVLRYIF